MLVRLLYASRSVGAADQALLDSVLEVSRSRNLEHGITGVLCAHPRSGVFMQALEGARPAVNALYANIVRDARHRDVTLLCYEEIEERRFSGWRMGRVDADKLNVGTILRYSEGPVLDPFKMTGKAALALLEELAASAAVTSRD